MNGKVIYPIPRDKPVEITIPANPTKIVVTDGFHITQPFVVSANYRQQSYYAIGCGIEDDQLIVSAIIMAIIYSMGLASDVWLFYGISIAPLIYLIIFYYTRRKDFIRIRQV